MSTSAFPSGAAEERHVSIPIGSIHLQGSLVGARSLGYAILGAVAIQQDPGLPGSRAVTSWDRIKVPHC